MALDIDAMIAKLEEQQNIINRLKRIKELEEEIAKLKSELPLDVRAELNGEDEPKHKRKARKSSAEPLDNGNLTMAGDEMVRFLAGSAKSTGAMFSTIRKHLNDKGLRVEGAHIGQIAKTEPYDKLIERVPDTTPPFYRITAEGKSYFAKNGKAASRN
jgi:hypothetical protein